MDHAEMWLAAAVLIAGIARAAMLDPFGRAMLLLSPYSRRLAWRLCPPDRNVAPEAAESIE